MSGSMNSLLLMACSGTKRRGCHPAKRLYTGAMWNVLNKWMPKEGAPDLFVLSAKYGLVAADDILESYDQKLSIDAAARFVEQGVDVELFSGRRYGEVFIAGGVLYRFVLREYVAKLRDRGIVAPDAEIKQTVGGIGVMRGQLAAYLAQLGKG